MLLLDSQTRVTTQLIRDADDSIRVEIHSRSVGGSWTRHAVARIDVAQRDVPAGRTGSPAAGGTTVSPTDFYTELRRTGAHHGQAFAALTRIVRTPGGWAETDIVMPDEATPAPGNKAASRDARRGAAKPGCRDADRIPFGFDRSHISAGRNGVHPGVRGGRQACTMPRRAGEHRGRQRGCAGPGHPDGRHGDTALRRSPASTCGACNVERCHCRCPRRFSTLSWVRDVADSVGQRTDGQLAGA